MLCFSHITKSARNRKIRICWFDGKENAAQSYDIVRVPKGEIECQKKSVDETHSAMAAVDDENKKNGNENPKVPKFELLRSTIPIYDK